MDCGYKTKSSECVYSGKIFNVFKDVISLPNKKEATREYVVHNGAAAIVPVDDKGHVIFVRQYRHPAGQLVLEIPAGTLEKGEDPLCCAARELEEETGFKANELMLLTKMYSAIGFCTEVLYIYSATGLSLGKLNPDEDEFIEIETYPLQEAIEMIFNGEIKDSKTIVGLLTYKEMLNK